MIQKCCKYNFDSNDTFGSVCLKEKQNKFMIPFILISEELRAYGGETELNFKHMNRKKLLMAFAVIICLGLSGYGYYRYDRDKRDEAFKQAEESLILSFKENDEWAM